MFSINIFDSDLELLVSTLGTILVGIVFFGMTFSYTKKRSGKSYSYGRVKAPSISIFRNISKLMFVGGMLLTMISFWVSSILLLSFFDEIVPRLVGVTLVLVGYINLGRAFDHLGDNYSPSFDAYIPNSLITTGRYRIIRHPVYLFNLFVSFGLAISSGSGVVMLIALVGLLFILKIISIEEACLHRQFPEYKHYVKTSWRLIPLLY